MIRKFSLVILDNRDKVIDRMNLDLVTNPRGLGFSLDTSVVSTEIEDILISYRQKLESITFDVNFANGREYLKTKSLRLWIEKNIGKKMAVEWKTDTDTLFAECIVDKFDFSEINEDKYVSIPLNIKRLTPFFILVENEIKILPSSSGKRYPYKYSYTYGVGVVSNNIIVNNYIKKIPLNITLYGEMLTPSVSIKESGTAEPYSTVAFEGLSLDTGHWLNINAINRKITYYNGVIEVDGYNYIDGTKNSFIYANAGVTSQLSASVQSDKTGRLEASFRRYML